MTPLFRVRTQRRNPVCQHVPKEFNINFPFHCSVCQPHHQQPFGRGSKSIDDKPFAALQILLEKPDTLQWCRMHVHWQMR